MKWFCHSSLEQEGYDKYNIFETIDNDEDSAQDIGWDYYAIPWAQELFSVIDPITEQDEYEYSGYIYGIDYIFDDDIYCYIEEYDAEKHDKYFEDE